MTIPPSSGARPLVYPNGQPDRVRAGETEAQTAVAAQWATTSAGGWSRLGGRRHRHAPRRTTSTLTTSFNCTPHRHPTTSLSVIMPIVFLCPRRRGGGIKRYRDPSVCLFQGAAAIVYRHAGCLQLSHRRTADPPEVELPSAGGISSRRHMAIPCFIYFIKRS